MRRTLPALLAAAVILAACGSDDDAETASTDDASSGTAAAPAASDAGDTDDQEGAAADDTADVDTGDSEPAGTDDAEPSGTDDAAGDTSTDGGATSDTALDEDPTGASAKPEVEIPDTPPTELEVTTLVEGTGAEAGPGDTVIVDYVGVRSVDGVEFDNSYDRGEPFALTLGSGGVIEGWEQGLQGVQGGQQVQLDIPSELAYGEQARSDVIGENESLTFVIDVRAVIDTDSLEPPAEAGVPESVDASETTTVDLIEGDGATLEEGDTALFHFVLFRGDNLVALDTSWETDVIQLTIDENAFPGLLKGMPGMKVGGRRAIVIPPEDGFGDEGNPPVGLPAETDLVIVVDLLGIT